MMIHSNVFLCYDYIISSLTLRFSKLRTFFSTVCKAKTIAVSLPVTTGSVEAMLEAGITVEVEVETRDADGIVAIERMMKN